MLSGSAYFHAFLKAQGVHHLFGVPGAQIDPLYSKGYGTDTPLSIVFARHECAAGYMAEGYARITKKMGVSFSIGGPGCVQMLPAVLNAAAEHIPLLFVSADGLSHHEYLNAFQSGGTHGTRDQETMALHCKLSLRITSAEDWPKALKQLWQSAHTFPQGPVHLQIPFELWHLSVPAPPPIRLQTLADSRHTLPSAISLPPKGPRIAVLVGSDFATPHAGALQAWLEANHLPVCTSLDAKGLISETHTLSFGVFGYAGHQKAVDLLCGELDSFILLGVTLNERNTLNWKPEMFHNRQIYALGCTIPEGIASSITYAIKASPHSHLDFLSATLESSRLDRQIWLKNRPIPADSDPLPAALNTPQHPASLSAWIAVLARELPHNMSLFVDAGQIRSFVSHYWPSQFPGQIQQASIQAPMGWSLAAGIGASLASKQRVCILLGDGSLLMQGMELSVAVKYKLPVCCIVSNNNSWGSVQQRLATENIDACFAPIDYQKWAQALGVTAFYVDHPDQLANVLQLALTSSGPSLIEISTPVSEVFPEEQTRASALGSYAPTATAPLSILVSSIGSLVGQNILDMARHSHHALRLIGLNSEARAVRNYHCDQSYLVHPLADPQAVQQILQILEQEQPDLILPGRDSDTLFWALFAQQHPHWANRIAVGNVNMAHVFLDKAASQQFCLQHQLPFAASLPLDEHEEAARQFGFPLIAKPRQGYGSGGIRLVFTPEELTELSHQVSHQVDAGDYLLQEWLGKNIPERPDLSYGTPLFWGFIEQEQYASEVIIGPDGTVLGRFSGRHHMQNGYCIYSERHEDPQVEAMVDQVTQTFIAAGWRGVLNLQYKPNRQNQWKIFEFNGRITGGSSSRLHLGFDELSLLLTAWCKTPAPVQAKTEKSESTASALTVSDCTAVFRYYQDFPLYASDLQQLEQEGQWKKY